MAANRKLFTKKSAIFAVVSSLVLATAFPEFRNAAFQILQPINKIVETYRGQSFLKEGQALDRKYVGRWLTNDFFRAEPADCKWQSGSEGHKLACGNLVTQSDHEQDRNRSDRGFSVSATQIVTMDGKEARLSFNVHVPSQNQTNKADKNMVFERSFEDLASGRKYVLTQSLNMDTYNTTNTFHTSLLTPCGSGKSCESSIGATNFQPIDSSLTVLAMGLTACELREKMFTGASVRGIASFKP